MTRVLLIVDIQNDYFEDGANPLVGAEAAAERAGEVLDAFRASGDAVVHVQHVWDEPDAPFMRPGTSGVEIHDRVAPRAEEPVVTKDTPNALLAPGLPQLLADLAPDELVVLGMMTSMCVDSTVRAACEAGFTVSLVHDACAAPDLELGGVVVGGAAVHTAFAAALGDGFATLVSAAEVAAPA